MENVPLLEQFEVKNAQPVNCPQIARITQGTFLNFSTDNLSRVFKIIGHKSQKKCLILYVQFEEH